MKDKAEFVLKLDPKMLLDLCAKDPQLEVAIKKSALNYLRNSMLKPLMKSEIVKEIENYRRELNNHAKEILKDMGIREAQEWNNSYPLLSDKIKTEIKQMVITNINSIVTSTVHEEFNATYQKFKSQIELWKKSIENLCKNSITENTIKEIAKEVIENKFKGK